MFDNLFGRIDIMCAKFLESSKIYLIKHIVYIIILLLILIVLSERCLNSNRSRGPSFVPRTTLYLLLRKPANITPTTRKYHLRPSETIRNTLLFKKDSSTMPLMSSLILIKNIVLLPFKTLTLNLIVKKITLEPCIITRKHLEI